MLNSNQNTKNQEKKLNERNNLLRYKNYFIALYLLNVMSFVGISNFNFAFISILRLNFSLHRRPLLAHEQKKNSCSQAKKSVWITLILIITNVQINTNFAETDFGVAVLAWQPVVSTHSVGHFDLL